jgi:hypothetical protein
MADDDLIEALRFNLALETDAAPNSHKHTIGVCTFDVLEIARLAVKLADGAATLDNMRDGVDKIGKAGDRK